MLFFVRAAAVDHHRARRVRGHHGIVGLGDFLLVAVHVRRVAEQVDEVDERELVLDGPDLDGRMIPLALDLRDALVAPVLHQGQLEFRAALLPARLRIALAEGVADGLAVERGIAADDDAVAVAELQPVLRFHAQPARVLTRLAGRA